MKVIIVDDKKKVHLNGLIDWLIYMVGYTIVLVLVSVVFKSVSIDNSYFGLWAFLASIIIYILNKTVKPIIFLLTLPITGITLGLFYPVINVLILKMVDWILVGHFTTQGTFSLFFVAILISIMNFLMEKLIVEPIVRRGA
jgi:putative membrane protein